MKQKSLMIFSFLFLLIIRFDTFATIYESHCNKYETTSSSGYEEVDNYTYYNQLMTLSDVKVSFTQDDNKYKFEITANANLNSDSGISNGKSNGNDTMQPMLYKVANFGQGLEIIEKTKIPYADFRNGDLYTNTSLNIKGVNIGSRVYKYHVTSSTHITNENTTSSNGDKFFIPNAARSSVLNNSTYRNAITYPISIENNGEGVELKNNSSANSISTYVLSGLTYIGGISSTISVEIEVEKNYIDDYRYICFGTNMPVYFSELYNTYWAKRSGISICTNTIDLKSYTNCNHSWSIVKKDGTTHTMKCSKCDWEKSENHDYKYEYDGIKKDLCECGTIKQIKIYSNFNSNNTTNTTQTININGTYTRNNNPVKTGYIFKNFKKYTYNPKTPYSETTTPITKTFVSDVNIMDTNAGELSLIYEAMYEPIKYTVKYDKTNNKSIEVTLATTELKDRVYDTEYAVQTLTYAGYKFLGWTKTKNSDIVDIGINSKFKNLTTKNGDTITLYPVFTENKYKFKFSKVNNLNLPINSDIKDLECGYGIKYKLPSNIDLVGYNFLGWSLTKGSKTINFNKNAEIYNFTTVADKEYILYPVYEPKRYKFSFSKINNLGLKVNDDIKDLVCDYGTTYSLPDNIEVVGYKFLGWTFTKELTSINFGENAMIYNYTDIDNKEYTLYPVYDYRQYTIKCNYRCETLIKSILLENVIVEKKRDLPQLKILPITKQGYGWFYNNKKIENSLDLDKYITKDNQIITTEYKLDEGASAYADDIKEFTYTIKCDYWQETATKSIILQNVVIGTKRELPQLKILPITKQGYGWYINNIKVNSSIDIDSYVVKNNDVITIEYKLDDGASAYADEVKEFIYTIRCNYWQETATKSYIIKNVKIGSFSELPKIKVLPITKKGYGWFFKDNKVSSSLDVDQYVKKNNEIITLTYKVDDGASAYIKDNEVKDFIYNINCEFLQNGKVEVIPLKNIVIGRKTDFPKIKVLPLSAKAYGWFYKDICVSNSLDIDQFVVKNNETLTIIFKTDENARCYTDDTLTFKIKYIANITGFGNISTVSTINLGNNEELLKLENLPDNIHVVGWYRDNKYKTIKTTGELEQFVTYNNQIITLYLYWHFPTGVEAVSHNSGKGDGGGGGNGPSAKNEYNKTTERYLGPGVENVSVSGNANSITTENSSSIIDKQNDDTNNNIFSNNNFSNQIFIKNDSINKLKKESITNDNKYNIDLENFCGPMPLTEEDRKFNVRGIHGPWNYSKDYINELLDKIELKNKTATISEIIDTDSDDEILLDGDINKSNSLKVNSADNAGDGLSIKYIIIVAATVILLISVGVYEFFTIRTIIVHKNK